MSNTRHTSPQNKPRSSGRKPLGVRALAAQALAPVLAGERSLGATLPAAQRACRSEDVALLQELVQGTVRSTLFYRALLKPLLQRAPSDPLIEALLLLGVHQLLAMRIPDHAALAETVEATRQLGKDKLTGFINGVLRSFQRQESELLAAHAAHAHAHPAWLLTHIHHDWPNQADAIITANNNPAALTLRVHRQRGDRAQVLALLITQGLPVEATHFSPDGLRLTEPVPIKDLPGLAEGDISVQDEAAQLAACLLAPQAGERVLDACAAPGGKTAHLLEVQPEMAALIALDSDEERLVRVRENIIRAGFVSDSDSNTDSDVANSSKALAVHVRCAQAEALDSWWDGVAFDAILLDAPCSGTGVIRRHPDIKLLRRATDIAKTVSLQATLLDQLWLTLKPGGRLLYATCSLLKCENEEQIAAFLKRTADAEAGVLTLPGGMPGEARPQGYQLLPTLQGHDGFYFAMLVKKAG